MTVACLVAVAGAQAPVPPPMPPEALASLRGVAGDAARNCQFFLD